MGSWIINEQSSGSGVSLHAAEDAAASTFAMETPVTTRQRPAILLRRFDPLCVCYLMLRSAQITFFFSQTLCLHNNRIKNKCPYSSSMEKGFENHRGLLREFHSAVRKANSAWAYLTGGREMK